MSYLYGLVDADTLELRYIGQTINLRARSYDHRRAHPSLRLIILERDPSDIDEIETRWIRETREQGADLLNIALGGNSHSPDTCAKIRATLMGHAVSDETRAKMHTNGKGKNTGRPLSAKHRASISAAMLGNRNGEGGKGIPRATCWLGRRHTPAALAKIGAASRGRVHSAESRARVSAALTGRTLSLETRAKISATKRGAA